MTTAFNPSAEADATQRAATQVPLLGRITTRYDAAEDRMVLWGTVKDVETQQEQVRGLWFTQRMLRGTLPHWIRWLDARGVASNPGYQNDKRDSGADTTGRHAVLQAFEQSAAREMLQGASDAQTAPVAPAAASAAWLVRAITLITPKEALGQEALLQLVFLTEDDEPVAAMELSAFALRQWLDIVYRAWVKAQWSLEGWPQWMEPVAHGSDAVAAALH